MAKTSGKIAVEQFLKGELDYADFTIDQEKYFKRVQAVEAMLLYPRNKLYIRNVLIEKFGMQRQATYKLIKETEQIFGSLREVNKNMKRSIAENMALKAFEMAVTKDDPKGAAAATRAYLEASGANNEAPELPDFQKIMAAANILALPAAVEKYLSKITNEGVIDLTKSPQPVEYTDYEDIEPGEGGAAAG